MSGKLTETRQAVAEAFGRWLTRPAAALAGGDSMEVERKWKLPEMPALRWEKVVDIRQAYLGDPSEEAEVRVRRQQTRRSIPDHTMTIKSGTPPAREERTQEISSSVFYSTFRASDLVVSKTRHVARIAGGYLAEIDQFYAPDLDWCLMEIEFPHEPAATGFDLSATELDVSGAEEVTGNPSYLNRNIASRS